MSRRVREHDSGVTVERSDGIAARRHGGPAWAPGEGTAWVRTDRVDFSSAEDAPVPH